MRAIAVSVALLAASLAQSALAQVQPPPSATYVFGANLQDVRALWINPAGLGILPEASIYGEVHADRATDDWGVRQWAAGLSARNVAVGYQKDRFPAGGSDGRWRLGGAIPLAPRMAIGTAMTFYSPGRATDVGLRFSPARLIDVGLVVRGIGRPTVDNVPIPISGVAGFAWRVAGGRAAFMLDATATERRPLEGYHKSYHAGLLVIPPARTPISLLAAVDFESDLAVTRWSLGIALGAQNQLVMVGSALDGGTGSKRFQSLNAAAVARGQSRR